MSVALELSKQKLDELEKEIQSKIGDIVNVRDELVKDIKKLERGTGGTNGGGPAISDEQLIEAVKGNPGTAKVIAGALGVDSRTVARRLSKMAADGTISGDKEAGYATS